MAKRAKREARKQAAAAAPVASPEALQGENERLTKLRERDRTEIRNLRRQVKDLASKKGFGTTPLPRQISKLVAHLGNESDAEREMSLKRATKLLRDTGQNWSDVANQLVY